MQNLFSRLFKIGSAPIAQDLYEIFLNEPKHQWIIQDRRLMAAFDELYDLLQNSTSEHLESLQRPLIFTPGAGILSCAINPQNSEQIIVLFPDLIRLLKSGSPRYGLAVLAHEIGHLVHNHASRNIGSLEAQVEADEFAFELGLGVELQDVLLDAEQNLEVKVRISRLTSLVYANAGQVL